ncbi:sensor histidine kinase [Halorubrum tebenquichense]|uniref:histidine kinase n=1 Tax=Halorubrum tebenquichense DSM 14210 TaxID=1227485 RepID=M0DG76_9EURY|nr:PAS domain-containing sensor histidine kinase [Halorubrum tebenquichense]ELZ33164.1 PAS/PAC sensor signal transduction histidine kinase [Halorubrum tebenquichense DSM 14210]
MSNEPADDRGARESAADDRRPPVEERYRKVFEHSNDAVMVVDFETESFVDVNPTACELLGYSREELLSMNPEDIHPDDFDRVREEFVSQVRAEGSGFTDDLMCLTKGGDEIPTEISGATLDPARGETATDAEPTRMVAMLRDISGRARNRQRLEEKVERLDRFAGIVSHDLRNPLSIIQGHAELARETGDSKHFDAVEDAAARMEEMLSDLLRLTREGDLVGERTEIDLATIARDVWADCEMDPAILDVESTTTLRADRDRLHELLVNLFENARNHGGSDVTVRVGTLDEEGQRGFYVEDNGTGVPPEDRETVFEWGHTTTGDGTGFGLAIVDEIADAHGWEIGLKESADGGARFEVAGVRTSE